MLATQQNVMGRASARWKRILTSFAKTENRKNSFVVFESFFSSFHRKNEIICYTRDAMEEKICKQNPFSLGRKQKLSTIRQQPVNQIEHTLKAEKKQRKKFEITRNIFFFCLLNFNSAVFLSGSFTAWQCDFRLSVVWSKSFIWIMSG